MLKKFNQYMLENHPLTWHSKFIQLLAAGLLFWLISFVAGYFMVDLDTIKVNSLSRHYSRSNFVSFHVIYCLIVLCLWAIFFYKNNAIKSFYPLQRFYLVRMFLQLFVAFSLLVSANYPFLVGCYAKVRTILPQEEFEKDIYKFNLGQAFLVGNNEYPYNFEHRPDYEALNYDYVKFNKEDSAWKQELEYYYYPELADEKYITSDLLYRDFITGNDSSVTVIDGERYIFFTTVTKYSGPDSCTSIVLVKEIHKLELEDLQLHSLSNYQGHNLHLLSPAMKNAFEEKEIPKIHRWTAENQKDSIRNAIRGLLEVCKKYRVSYQDLNPALIATYLEAKNYRNLSGFVADYPQGKRDFQRIYQEEYAVIQKYADGKPVSPEDRKLLIKAMEDYQTYIYYDSNTMDEIISAYLDAQQGIKMKDFVSILLISFFVSFFLAWLFLFFEFANIISLLISIPIGGALMILVGVFIAYVNIAMRHNYDYNEAGFRSAERISAAIIFCVCLIILLVTIFGIYSKQFNKRILNVLVNLSYAIAPVFISFLVIMLNVFSGHHVYERCNTSNYEYDFEFLIKPEFMLLSMFIGIFAIFPLIIKWRAKEE